ncbi:MAG: SDR family NAD(P)-dependent oxidoreductase [Dehalococcoidia bacterium]
MAGRSNGPRFEGKVAVVTGGAQGIGLATALRFAEEGADVALIDLPGSPLPAAAHAVRATGRRVLTVEADVTQADQVQRYADAVEAEFGGAHCFFNNAGILGPVTRSFLDYPEDAFDQVLAVNVKGVWLGLRAMAPLIAKSGGGSIVNTASVAGIGGTPTIFAYGASKHAVVGMTKSAAISLGPQGVRVNAVCPAPIDTAMADQLTGTDDPAKIAERKERFAQANLLGRIGEPEDVAALVAFLCSEDASFVTGGIYTVDGGSRTR